MAIDLSDYKEVSERIQDFRTKHPDGSLQAEIVTLTDSLVVVKAYAYRTPDDPRPGVGLASEPIPGRTPYTKDSELMNAETSAWGRAIIAVGASDAKKVASRDEIANRREADPIPEPPSVTELAVRTANKLKTLALELTGDPDTAKALFTGALESLLFTESDLRPDDFDRIADVMRANTGATE